MYFIGYAGGGWYNHKGSPTNYLCLPSDPSIGPVEGGSSYLYGTEYQGNFGKQHTYDEDVPCAVCRSPQHTSTLMIPARDHCYPGWNMQYTGRLASSYYDHPSGKNYVCVDKDPDYIAGGLENKNGALFYEVSTVCGSLPCPPYTNGSTVLCVVCTK